MSPANILVVEDERIDAMPRGGQLTLAAWDTALDAAQAALHPGTNPGPLVVLTVTDTGTGMSREVMAKIFEPFFTTTPPGRGTGLGLLSTLDIVRRHGGFIELDSEPNRETEFRLCLPAAKDK